MFFRNLCMFRFPASTDFTEIAALLPQVALKPVGALEMTSAGFISPFGREETKLLHHQQGDFIWLTVGTETKILPSAVVNKAMHEKLTEIETKEGRKPGGRERKRLKDDLLHEMLPRAFVRPGRTDVFLDTRNGVAFVDSSSRKTGENVMSAIRGMLGSFPAMPLNAEVAPRSILTAWIAGEPMGDLLSLGEEAELKDPAEGGAQAKVKAQELRSDEIDKHLDAGKMVSKLALVHEDHIAFTLGDDLVVRKLKFLDGALDQLEFNDEEGRRAELDARFALQIGELRKLFDTLQTAFKISRADDETELERANRQRHKTAIDAAPTTSPESIRMAGIEDAARRAGEGNADDPLYQTAVKVVREEGKAGIALLQHRLSIGYNRAARLIEAMEAAGVVGVEDRMTGARTVLPTGEP